MKVTRTFKLERPARKSGGDRYAQTGQGKSIAQVVYIDQDVSRPDGGRPVDTLEITVETK